MANPDRPYNMWPDKSGALNSLWGALLPDGYELDTSTADRPWICPVRSCRCLLRTRQDLGHHFKISHCAAWLNDNLDGTFSVVHVSDVPGGVRSCFKNYPPAVVSRAPSSIDQDPIADPEFWLFNGARCPETKNTVPSGAVLSNPHASNDVWRHIYESHFRGPVTIPESKVLASLLKLCSTREFDSIRKFDCVFRSPLGRRKLAALIIQVIGAENPKPCNQCRRGQRQFASCVNLSESQPLWQYPAKVCGNCLYHGTDTCSEPSTLDSLSEKPDVNRCETVPNKTAVAENKLVGPRRSERATTSPKAKRKLVTMNVPTHIQKRPKRHHGDTSNGRRNSVGSVCQDTDDTTTDVGVEQRALSIPPGQRVPEEDLHMEDWELGEGRIVGTQGGSSSGLAFAPNYITTRRQSVQVRDNIAFFSTSIPSGTMHRFEPDLENTRVCAVASGKITVQVDGEPEFKLGPQGMFPLQPGASCTVLNTCYALAVLHITSVSVGR
ncbi:hypothetical protein QBC46DRAFT_258636 [Diplogelasinospora grovesii]|uniref:Uncharacterized protein n=1 Tax=Diplogelasinospora grovesii TaxID=303347 RepID=A0AAN6S5N4_9PEZI|nr:hypothetical protein QBC46DRAFT_258636 [Diplogelasinospora grovesii]